MAKKTLFFIIIFVIINFLTYSYALTPEEVVRLKKAGVSDNTIWIMLQLEARNPFDYFGVREVKDKEGNIHIIYSTGQPPKSSTSDEETEKAWKMLQNIIIDRRQ